MSTQLNVPQLDCHLADEAELKTFEYVDWRIKSAQDSRASWYVGCVDYRVVTAMGSYPIVLRAGGHPCPGYGIGGGSHLTEIPTKGLCCKAIELGLAEATQCRH